MLYARNNYRLTDGKLNPTYNELAPSYDNVACKFNDLQHGIGRNIDFAPKLDWKNLVTLVRICRVRGHVVIAKGELSQKDFTNLVIRRSRGEVIEGSARTFEWNSRQALEYAWRLIGEKYNLPAADPETGEAYAADSNHEIQK